MKKIAAILLLLIHAFNIAGYAAVVKLLQQKASNSVAMRLDSGAYNVTDLVEIKVPVSMPYANQSNDYERCDGQIEIGGVNYNFVKRKLYGDTLYLLCIPNHEVTKLAAAKNGYTQVLNDVAGSSQGKKSQPTSSNGKPGLGEYSQVYAFGKTECPIWSLPDLLYPGLEPNPVQRPLPVQLQPPNISHALLA